MKGIDGDIGLEALRQHDLVDVTGADVLLSPPDRRLVRLSASYSTATQAGSRPPRRLMRAHARARAPEKDLRLSKVVCRAQVGPVVHIGVGDDENSMLHMVKSQHRVEEHESGIIRRVRGIRSASLSRRLPATRQ